MTKTLNKNKKVWLYLGVVLLAIFGILFGVWYFRVVFRYIFIAILILYLMKPFIDFLEGRGVKKGRALGIIFVCFLVLIVGIVKVIVPMVLVEIDNFNEKLPEIEQRINQNVLRVEYNELGDKVGYYSPFLNMRFAVESIDSILRSFGDQLKSAISGSLSLFLSSLIIVPVLLYIFIKEGDSLKKKMFGVVPNRYFELTLSMFHDINKSIENFISAKLIQSAIMAVIASLGFYVVGIKLPYLLGLVVGIFNIIPYIGPFLGAVPAIAVGYLLGNEKTALLALGVILFAQLVDNLLLQPFLIPKLIKEHPLVVVLITLIGADLLGPLGMVIAIPVFSIIKTVLVKAYSVLDIAYSREEIKGFIAKA